MFTVFKSVCATDADGDTKAARYEKIGYLRANLQPVSDRAVSEAFGAELRCFFHAYTTGGCADEGCFIGFSKPEYLVLSVERWQSHKRLYLEKVNPV